MDHSRKKQSHSTPGGTVNNVPTQSGTGSSWFGGRVTVADHHTEPQTHTQVSEILNDEIVTMKAKLAQQERQISDLLDMLNGLAEEVYFQHAKQDASTKAIDRLFKLHREGQSRVEEQAQEEIHATKSFALASAGGHMNKVKSLFKSDRKKVNVIPRTDQADMAELSMEMGASPSPSVLASPYASSFTQQAFSGQAQTSTISPPPPGNFFSGEELAASQGSAALHEIGFDPDDKDTGRQLHMLVAAEAKDLLQADGGKALVQISKDTDAFVGLGAKVSGRPQDERSTNKDPSKLEGQVYILNVKQMTPEAQVQHAVQRLLTLLNPGVRDTSKHKLVILVRKNRVEDVIRREATYGPFPKKGIDRSYDPLRPDIKRAYSSTLATELTEEMTVHGDLPEVQAFLGTLIEKGAIGQFAASAAPAEESPRRPRNLVQQRPQESSIYNNKEPPVLDHIEQASREQDFQREKDDVKLQMEQFGLTEACLKDTAEDAVSKAIAQGRQTCKGRILIVITSRYFQLASLVCIILNLIVMWLEVDAGKDSPDQARWSSLQYALTCCFMVEAMLNIIAFPEICQFKEMLFDCAVVIFAFFFETLSFLFPEKTTNSTWLLMLRVVRLFRFVRMIRNRGGARTVRVLMAALMGSVLNLFWISLFLMMIFYCGAIIFRSLLREINNPDAVIELRNEYFLTVPATMLTLIETFLDSFDYSTKITRPLLSYDDSVTTAYVWIGYHLIVRLVVVNIIAGLCIEQLTRSAAMSDERSAKETFAANDVTFNRIARVFDIIDTRGEGRITHNDFKRAWSKDEDVERLLQITKAPFNGDHLTFFHFIDVQGVGELTFSDFAFGVIAHRCGSTSIDKMIFDHASKSLIRQSADTKKRLSIAQKTVEESSNKVNDIDKQVRRLKAQYSGQSYTIEHRVEGFKDNIRAIREGLGIGSFAVTDAKQRGLSSPCDVREARNIQNLMKDLKVEIAKASDVAQSQVSSVETTTMLARLREEADKEISRGVDILQKHQATATRAAQTAARAARAIAAVQGCSQQLPMAPPPTHPVPPMSALVPQMADGSTKSSFEEDRKQR